ncbi:hypothetical protein ACNQ1D_26505, partial [Enterobacter cloacae complex sp.6700005]|uniref:hypothetical protein n=1 Tax=Enterobacter cloacae complex sp.6700005 TaxID=3397180 RepID=UPI003AACF894
KKLYSHFSNPPATFQPSLTGGGQQLNSPLSTLWHHHALMGKNPLYVNGLTCSLKVWLCQADLVPLLFYGQ